MEKEIGSLKSTVLTLKSSNNTSWVLYIETWKFHLFYQEHFFVVEARNGSFAEKETMTQQFQWKAWKKK